MKLEEIKKIAAARTPGEWIFEEILNDVSKTYEVKIGNYFIEDEEYYPSAPNKNDAQFMVMAANKWDKLIDVVEVMIEHRDELIHVYGGFNILKALKALEQE